ncbi:hypothetical protein M8494_03540 [Serratia ureilytica]
MPQFVSRRGVAGKLKRFCDPDRYWGADPGRVIVVFAAGFYSVGSFLFSFCGDEINDLCPRG